MGLKSESKYERLRKIGIGSYGVVFKCVERQTGQIVAIKRYSENDSDAVIRKIAMREVRMLRQLKHPNLITLIEVFRRKKRLHLVFDYCELTVLDVIEKYANNCPLTLIKKIVWQTVNAINYCHTHNCIHRDIKPENILINQSGVVKLCDFGFARTINQHQNADNNKLTPVKMRRGPINSASAGNINKVMFAEKENKRESSSQLEVVSAGQGEELYSKTMERQALTEYVATRWYRAPELLIGEIYYDIKIDIWAIGCVTAELMRGAPVWPGKTDLDQLCIIKNSLGSLTESQVQTLISQSIYEQSNIELLVSKSEKIPTESLERKLPARIGQNGIDFVLACLHMNPDERLTSEELLRHAYIYPARMAQLMDSGGGFPTTRSSTSNSNSLVRNRQVATSGSLASKKRISSSTSSSGSRTIGSRSEMKSIYLHQHRHSVVSTSSSINYNNNNTNNSHQKTPFIGTNQLAASSSGTLSKAGQRLNSHALMIAAAASSSNKSNSLEPQNARQNLNPAKKRILVAQNSSNVAPHPQSSNSTYMPTTKSRTLTNPTGVAGGGTTVASPNSSSIPRAIVYKQTTASPNSRARIIPAPIKQPNLQELKYKRKQPLKQIPVNVNKFEPRVFG